MHTLTRLGLWLSLALAGFTGCTDGTDSPTSSARVASGETEIQRIIDPPPAVLLPFRSPVANAHHQWMRDHWARIQQSAASHHTYSATPFRLDDPNDWLELSPPILELVRSMEQGRVPAGYETALDASRQLQYWVAAGLDPDEIHRRLSAHPVAVKHPQHFEILMSTWLVGREHGQELGETLGEYGMLVDMIGAGISGPVGAAAASAGYLVGRMIREYW
jgi:hypothetical protein